MNAWCGNWSLSAGCILGCGSLGDCRRSASSRQADVDSSRNSLDLERRIASAPLPAGAVTVVAWPWWWLSFADPARPKGRQFLGAAIVQGADIKDAVSRTWSLVVNPGGQIQYVEIPAALLPPEDMRGRLLGREDAERLAAAIDRQAPNLEG